MKIIETKEYKRDKLVNLLKNKFEKTRFKVLNKEDDGIFGLIFQNGFYGFLCMRVVTIDLDNLIVRGNIIGDYISMEIIRFIEKHIKKELKYYI